MRSCAAQLAVAIHLHACTPLCDHDSSMSHHTHYIYIQLYMYIYHFSCFSVCSTSSLNFPSPLLLLMLMYFGRQQINKAKKSCHNFFRSTTCIKPRPLPPHPKFENWDVVVVVGLKKKACLQQQHESSLSRIRQDPSYI